MSIQIICLYHIHCVFIVCGNFPSDQFKRTRFGILLCRSDFCMHEVLTLTHSGTFDEMLKLLNLSRHVYSRLDSLEQLWIWFECGRREFCYDIMTLTKSIEWIIDLSMKHTDLQINWYCNSPWLLFSHWNVCVPCSESH